MTDLPPFSGTDAICPKCGGTRIRAYWRAAIKESLIQWGNSEHMIRRCRSCGYEWEELPLDATPAEHADLVITGNPESKDAVGTMYQHIFETPDDPRTPVIGVRKQRYNRDGVIVEEADQWLESEPSIPVSRVVENLIDAHYYDGSALGNFDREHAKRVRRIARRIGVGDAYDAELALRKGTA